MPDPPARMIPFICMCVPNLEFAKVIVRGLSLQFGGRFVNPAAFIAPAEQDSSFTDFRQIGRLLAETRPDIVINCAAYNAVG